MKRNQNTKVWIYGGIALVVIVLIMWIIGTNNNLRVQQNNIDEKYSEIDNKMQRRYDLIPQLVDSVKGSMKHEDKVFGQLADARKSYANAKTPEEKVKADDQMSRSTNTIINAIAEDYPELKSNENVKNLMTQLEGTENRISVARRQYNKEVTKYNNQVVSFPDSIIANMNGYSKKPYFKADSAAKKVPKVDFGE